MGLLKIMKRDRINKKSFATLRRAGPEIRDLRPAGRSLREVLFRMNRSMMNDPDYFIFINKLLSDFNIQACPQRK